MTDHAAIAAARASGQAAESTALRLADRLVAGKADRARLRADLAALPGRISAQQQAVTEAQARVTAATQAQNTAAGRTATAQAQADTAQNAASAAEDAVERAREILEQLIAEREQPGNIQRAQRRVFDAENAAIAARRRAAAAQAAVAALAPALAAANAELTAARAELTTAQQRLAATRQQLADTQARQAAVEALPGTLSAEIATQRAAVTAAWRTWDGLITAELAGIAGAPAGDLERLRGELVNVENPDTLVSLISTEVPIALLPVRLETRFAGTDLLVRIYPDSAHVDTHEPELTVEELTWGRRHLEHERAGGINAPATLESWRVMTDRFGAPRAAWIARAAAATTPPQHTETWTRAARTNVLPDRWIVLGYQGGTRRFAVLSRPIPDTLVLGPDPGDAAAADPSAPLGESAQWLVNFDRAIERGMAVRVPVAADPAGFDRVVVVGLRASLDPAESARRLSTLLDAHHFTDGLAMLSPGTATNNTATVRSAWSPAGADPTVSLRAERGAAPTAGQADAVLLGRALGTGTGPLGQALGATGGAVLGERQMRTMLWPVTWGYLLDHLMGEIPDEVVAAARSHYLAHVASGGPLPVLRLGKQPYGVLPVTSLGQWRQLDPSDFDAQLVALLRGLASTWRGALNGVPRVTPGTDLAAVLADAVATSPVSLRYDARGLALPAPDAITFTRVAQALEPVRQLGLAIDPVLARAAFDRTAATLTGPLVVGRPVDATALPSGENYLAWLTNTGYETVRTGTPPAGANTLLFALLRHAVLRTYAITALRIVRARGLAAPGEGEEPGLNPAAAPSPWDRLGAPLEGVTAPGQTLGAHLDAVRTSFSPAGSPVAAQLTELMELQGSLRQLISVPTADLARLTGSVLDLAAHRYDAWVSAQATRKLATLRTSKPAGVRFGGYGVLEDVRRPTAARPASQGYVHAPSLGQAATAAVLRSGHLAQGGGAQAPLALDLSSRRVRLALTLLDGVRSGQPLGALLGYRLERGLHEHHRELVLDQFIAPLRALAPLDALTAAEHDLGVALTRRNTATQMLGQLQQQSAAAKAADTALLARVATAQRDFDAAQANSTSLSAQLQSARNDLQTLMNNRPGGFPSILTWRDNVAEAQTRIARLEPAVATATAATAAAAATLNSLRGQQQMSSAQVVALDQQVARQQAELDSAVAAVTAAQALVDLLRASEPRVSAALRARNVADGLGLRRRFRAGLATSRWDQTSIPFGASGLPALSSAQGQAITAELRELDDAVDALADVLVAESVHQVVQGNAQRAGATADALSRGDVPPPDVEVVRTPRAGTAVTHRLLVLADAAAGTGWPTDDTQVRALVEPSLEAWAGSVLGPANRVRVRVRSGTTVTTTDLSTLRLSALDALAMIPSGGPAGATEIEQALLDGSAPGAQLVLERDPAWTPGQLGLGEFLELARTVRELIDGARALDARDLTVPNQAANLATSPGTAPGIDTPDLAARTAIAVNALTTTRTRLAAALAGGPSAAVTGALARAAKLGVVGPGAAVLTELDRRQARLAAADSDLERVAAVLGDTFRLLPRVTPAAAGEFVAALAAGPELTGGPLQPGGDALAPVTWLQRAAHVRDGASRLELTMLTAEATGSPQPLRLRVAQLPRVAGERWVGLPAAAPQPVPGGRLSLVVQSAGTAPPPAGSRLAGLVVDEWTEVVPDANQLTGLSFHVDQPASRAPQAILLAVAPNESHLWNLAALEATLLETFDLARTRLVDGEALGSVPVGAAPRLGQYLPAAFLAAPAATDTVTTDLTKVSS